MRLPTAADSTDDLCSLVREQANGRILSRTCVGLWILMMVNILFTTVDLASRPANLSLLLVVRCAFIGLVIALLRVAGLPWARARATVLALLGVAAASAQVVVLAVLRGDVFGRVVFIVAIAVSTALVVPWGMRPQLITVAITGVGASILLWSAGGVPGTLGEYPVAAIA